MDGSYLMVKVIRQLEQRMQVFLAVALVCISGGGCGGASHTSSSPATVPAGFLASDEDPSTDDKVPRDDDRLTLEYGVAANSAEQSQIDQVVKRYYAAAAREDGAGACAVLSQRLARSSDLEGQLPEEYRPAPGYSLFRGKNCAQVESLIFQVAHRRLLQQASARLIAARVKGSVGLAFLAFRSTGEREVVLTLEDGNWRVDALLDKSLP